MCGVQQCKQRRITLTTGELEDAVIGAVFLLRFTIMDMEFRCIRQAIERTERRTKNLQHNLQCYISLRLIEAQNVIDEVFR